MLNKRMLQVVMSVLFLSGCTDETDSTDISTRAIWANIQVVEETPGLARVSVELNVGGPSGTNINLSNNERLEASIGGSSKVLDKDIDLFDIEYNTRLETSGFNDVIRVSYFRSDGITLNGSVVSLSDDFSITSPGEGQTFFDSDVISVTWTPVQDSTGGSIDLRTHMQCRTLSGSSFVSSPVRTVPDTGIASIQLLSETSLDNPELDKTKSCALSIILERRKKGVLDPAFKSGGKIESTQSRKVENMTIIFSNN